MWNISKIKDSLSKRRLLVLLAPVFVAFFLATSFYNYASQSESFVKWSSPDETANYTFTKLYAEEGRLEIAERYNILVKDIMHPRSFRVFDGVLKPMSFLGIILLYGQIAHFLGAQVIPFLTPFFATLGLLFYFLLLKEIFDKKVAFIAALMLAVFPIYFYFTSKSMFHNILFISLLVGGMYFLVKAAKRPFISRNFRSLETDWLKISYFCLGGAFIGWSIATRTSELLWLGPALMLLFIFNWRRVAAWQALLAIASALIILLPIFYQNIILYGGPLTSGYAEVNTSISTLTVSSNSLIRQAAAFSTQDIYAISKSIFKTIFYFGFKPMPALKLFWKYTVTLSPWLLYGSMIGFALWAAGYKKIRSGQLQLFLIFLIISAILITYYGSWDFHDNPDKSAVTIGNSYTRYWLPIYLCLIAWLAYALSKLDKVFRSAKAAWAVRMIIVISIAFSGWQSVFGAGPESLTTNIAKGKISYAQQQKVLELTERNSVIITKYQDKLFFPERKVVYGLFDDDNMVRQYSILARRLPTYFYSFTYPKNDLQYLNERRLPAMGLKLKPVTTIDEFSLYKLIPLSR
jgi:hypothetical protein